MAEMFIDLEYTEEVKLLPIAEFPGYYSSSCGHIFTKKRNVYTQMKTQLSKGYERLSLYVKGKGKQCLVHRLVCSSWIENSLNLPIVNHKDGNKQNNAVSNLEWVNVSQNATHSREKLFNKGYSREVIQTNLDGTFIAGYISLQEAENKTNIDHSRISSVCSGKRRSTGGFLWFYKEDYVNGASKQRLSANCKAVEQYNINGVFLRRFSSMKEAAVAIKGSESRISSSCSGGTKYKGFFFKKEQATTIVDKTESWVTLDQYPLYKISDQGDVYSSSHNKIMKQCDYDSYKAVSIIDKDKKRRIEYIHRLVASAYIKNPGKSKIVNHKDGNPSNNQVSNLEWCTNSENSHHALQTGLVKQKPVFQMLEGKIVARFDNAKTAADNLGLSAASIRNVCSGQQKTHGGYTWKYTVADYIQ